MSRPMLLPPVHDEAMGVPPAAPPPPIGTNQPLVPLFPPSEDLLVSAGPVRRGRTPTPRLSPVPFSAFPASSSSALPVSDLVDLTVRYGRLESELHMASQEALAAQEGQEHFRRLGSAQYASAKQAMYRVAEVYLEEDRQQATVMMEQEQQLVSRYGTVLVSEARAYQTALTEFCRSASAGICVGPMGEASCR